MEKKASELLLELEQKINLIIGYQKTNDLNYKLIIARLDKLTNIITQRFTSTTSLANSSTNVMFHEVSENQTIESNLSKVTSKSDVVAGKTQVQQKICYPDGKIIILANVEIYDIANKLVKKTRTNSAGKWTAALDPGRYNVKIFKPPTSNKPLVERKYEIEIPISEVPIEL